MDYLKFFINWIILTLNLSLTFTSILSLFNSNKQTILNKNTHKEIIINDNNSKYVQIAYLYPISIAIGFIIAFTKTKKLLILLCKCGFYIILIILFYYSTDMNIRSRDDLIASILVCSSDLTLVLADFVKNTIKKYNKKQIKEDTE